MKAYEPKKESIIELYGVAALKAETDRLNICQKKNLGQKEEALSVVAELLYSSMIVVKMRRRVI